MLDTAFEALKSFDWGSDLAALNPIEDAVVAANGKPELKQELENRLIEALKGQLTRDAQDYICRKLATIGTTAAVPTLAALLVNKGNSHMARFALERIPGPEAAQALRDALPNVMNDLKVGIISSLGSRRDSDSTDMLGKLLNEDEPAIARAAALALGAIGTVKSAQTLQTALNALKSGSQLTAIDAMLRCAESLLATNKRDDANSIYKLLAQDGQPRLVRLAATRGLLACASRPLSRDI